MEIGGCEPSRLFLRWFVAGKSMEMDVDIGFDASQDYHYYAVETEPNGGISFFVDDEMVHHEKTPDFRKVKFASHLHACNNSLPYCNQTIDYSGPTAMSLDWSKYCPFRQGSNSVNCEGNDALAPEEPPPTISGSFVRSVAMLYCILLITLIMSL